MTLVCIQNIELLQFHKNTNNLTKWAKVLYGHFFKEGIPMDPLQGDFTLLRMADIEVRKFTRK